MLKEILCGFPRWSGSGSRYNLFTQKICWRQTGCFGTGGAFSHVHVVMMFTATIPIRMNFYFEHVRRNKEQSQMLGKVHNKKKLIKPNQQRMKTYRALSSGAGVTTSKLEIGDSL